MALETLTAAAEPGALAPTSLRRIIVAASLVVGSIFIKETRTNAIDV